jgi:hypothetical protein
MPRPSRAAIETSLYHGSLLRVVYHWRIVRPASSRVLPVRMSVDYVQQRGRKQHRITAPAVTVVGSCNDRRFHLQIILQVRREILVEAMLHIGVELELGVESLFRRRCDLT